MTRKRERTLFGGALRSAGLATAMAMTSGAMAEFTAMAGPVNPSYTFNYGVGPAPDFTYHVFTYDYSYGGFPADTITSNQDGVLAAHANAFSMGASAYVAPGSAWQYAGVATQQYFTVDADKGATVTWDLLAGNGSALLIVYQFGVGYLLNQGAGTSGTVPLDLVAGEEYLFIAKTSMTGGFGESVFVSLTWVPAPGPLALLGLGAIAGRRRRREL